MANNIQCPVCQSILRPNGNVDFNAPALSVIICPVCGFPEWIPSGYPIPNKWTSLSVVNVGNANIKWSDFKAANPTTAANLEQTPQEALPGSGIYKDFSITKPIGELIGNISGGAGQVAVSGISGFFSGLLKSSGGIMLIVAGIIFLILFLKKGE